LRRIGGIMMQELRTSGDLAARYGGEEFCVILPNTHAEAPRAGAGETSPDEAGSDDVQRDADDAPATDGHSDGAAALAERLRRRIAACDFRIGPDHDPVSVTVSIGVSSFSGTADGMHSLVARADGALYAAKRAGKDQVRVY